MKGHPFLHFKTITKHRHIVMKHCFRVGIPGRGLLHDLSKYSPTEFREGAAHYQDATRSPTERERADYGYSNAWMHHKGRNRHHFEYWTDYNYKAKGLAPVKMPTKFLLEMFCDRVGACKVYHKADYYDGSAYDYFMQHKARYKMHPATLKALERLLFTLKMYGEDVAFKYIRKNFIDIQTADITSKNISRASKLFAELAKDGFFHKTHSSSRMKTAEEAEEYLNTQKKSGVQFFMASYRKRPAGFISLKDDNIFDLAVRQKERGKGIGEALLMCAVENCEGTPTAIVPADKTGKDALHYLYGRGFEDVESDKVIVGDRKLILTERLVERSAKRGL